MVPKRLQLRRKVNTERGARLMFLLIATLAIGALFAVLVVMIRQAVPAYQTHGFWHMMFTADYSLAGGYGIWGSLSITLFTSIFAVLISAPIALRVAFVIVFRVRRGRKALQILVNILAGVPSVVFGIFALRSLGLFSNAITGGGSSTIFNATIMLAMMILPTMIALIVNQLKLVPRELIDAAISLGNTRTRTLYRVVTKHIRGGFYVAIITAFTRAVGETMALSIVLKTGTLPNPFAEGLGPFLNSAQRSLGAQIAINIFSDSESAAASSPHFAAGVAMFIMTMVLVGGLSYVSRRQVFKINNPVTDLRKLFHQSVSMPWPYRVGLGAAGLLALPIKTLFWGFYWSGRLIGNALRWVSVVLARPWQNLIYRIPANTAPGTRYGLVANNSWRRGPDVLRLTTEWLALGVTLAFLLWMLGDVLAVGLPNWALNEWNFTRTLVSANVFEPSVVHVPSTLLNPMLFTLALIGITIAITMPFALITALYLSEYAQTSFIGKVVRFFIDALNGTPSIIFGIFGMAFFTRGGPLAVSPGFSVMAGALTLLLVTLPSFTRAIEQVLVAIPNELRNGAYALGATKVETMRRILVPQAVPGIITGVILSAGRIMAETAPLYLTIGMQGALSLDVLDQGWTLTTAIYNNQLYAISDLLTRTINSYKIAALSLIVIAAIIVVAESVQPLTLAIREARRLRSLKRTNFTRYLEVRALRYEIRRRQNPWLRVIDRALLRRGEVSP